MSIDFVAGCIGGAAGVIVGHPLDTVKVRLQTQSPDSVKYRGTFHALFTIAKQESVAGLYKGMSSPLYGVSFVNAIVFGVYGSLQPFVVGTPGNNSLWAHAAAGSIAGAVQSIVCSPMELVKIRMQLNESTTGRASSWEVLKSVYRTKGLRRGVFRGWGVTLSREIPGFGSYFASYEAMINQFEKYESFTNNAGQVSTLGMMLAGGTAGVISWLACFPMDVVKTRFQSDVTGAYTGVMDCARKTFQAEGFRVISRTLPSVVIRAFPMNAVTFPVVTWIMRFADSRQNDLQTSREEIDKLLEETKSRTQETLFQFHVPLPTYRMLTQAGGHHTSFFSTPGTGCFDTPPRHYYSYACLSASCDCDPVQQCQSTCDAETNPQIIQIQEAGDRIDAETQALTCDCGDTSVLLNAEIATEKTDSRRRNYSGSSTSNNDDNADDCSNSEHTKASEITISNVTKASHSSLTSILTTWFLNMSPTPKISCQCLDECVCCASSER